MEEKVLIVLFKSGDLQFYSNPKVHKKENFQKGARFFLVDDETPAIDICEWIGCGYDSTGFKEIDL